MKRVLLLMIAIILVCISLTSCRTKKTTSVNYSNSSITEVSNLTSNNVTGSDLLESEELSSSEALRLSLECDKVLASGYDKDNNCYELVVTQTESYDSVETKMGVILNNEWLVELSTEFPFLSEVGNNYDGSNIRYFYVEDGCFYLDHNDDSGIFYNSHTGKYIDCHMENDLIVHMNDNLKDKPKDSEKIIFTDNRKIVLSYTYAVGIGEYVHDIFVLNIDTMELNKIATGVKPEPVGPISDGLFAAGSSYDLRVSAFYNENYEKIIDLESYKDKWAGADTRAFKNGQYSFYVKNELGHKYELTIDKQGNVVNNIAVD